MAGEVTLEILVLFLLPVLLVAFGAVSPKRTFAGLVIVSLAILALAILKGMGLDLLGIRADNLSSSLLPYILFTILGIATVALVAKILRRQRTKDWQYIPHFRFLFIPYSFLQQFAFHGFLFPQLVEVLPFSGWAILVNALLFSFIHIIYPSRAINLPFGFIAGLAFSIMYYYFPNLILISLAHCVLNFTAVLYGFFSYRAEMD